MNMSVSDRISQAAESLETARRQIVAEIRGYPRPVSGCDAQFNQLLAERRRVEMALCALGQAPHIPTPRAP